MRPAQVPDTNMGRFRQTARKKTQPVKAIPGPIPNGLVRIFNKPLQELNNNKEIINFGYESRVNETLNPSVKHKTPHKMRRLSGTSSASSSGRSHSSSMRTSNYGKGSGKGGIKMMQKLLKTRTDDSMHARKLGLDELRRIQRSKENELQIPKLPFQRFIRMIMNEIAPGYKTQPAAILAMQESAECYLTRLMDASFMNTIHAGRVTLMPKDFQLTLRHQRIGIL